MMQIAFMIITYVAVGCLVTGVMARVATHPLSAIAIGLFWPALLSSIIVIGPLFLTFRVVTGKWPLEDQDESN